MGIGGEQERGDLEVGGETNHGAHQLDSGIEFVLRANVPAAASYAGQRAPVMRSRECRKPSLSDPISSGWIRGEGRRW